mgnify:CR=1 FL=1|nr:MAG TPA: hypothetical protein [Caudoviricetes sp.]
MDYPNRGDVYKSFYGEYITILNVYRYHGVVMHLDNYNKTQAIKLEDFMSTVTVTQNGTTRTLPMYTKCKEMCL